MAGAARRARLPTTVAPQLATLVKATPDHPGWAYELKYDGVRLLCRCDRQAVRCISRNGRDWTRKLSPIAAALSRLRLDGAWIDGELVATDPQGRSDFSLLQHVLERKRPEELVYCIFDLLFWKGEDLRALPLNERRNRLEAAFAKLPARGPLRLADQLRGDGPQLLARVCRQNFEGLMAKRTDSPYTGRRSRDWLKIKCHQQQEFIVGGAAYLPQRGTGTLSSLLVGVHSGAGQLRYVGRVGGGFDARERADWDRRARRLARTTSPFTELPAKRSGEVWRWMQPRLVVEVAFQDWTRDRILRQPRYLGLRQDKDPKTVVLEKPAKTESGIDGVCLTHPDRVLFPDGFTKRQLAEYFAAVGEHAMPHYQDRPLSILRNAHGTRPFFQKHFLERDIPGLRVVRIPNADRNPRFAVCESPRGLVQLAQLGAVELHAWGAAMPSPTRADRLTFDLDPGAGLPYASLREAALAVRRLLDELGLESWVKTTGGKGLHVVAPLTGKLPDWDAAREFSRGVTRYLERLAPTMFTSKSGERNRKRKIFVDYLRNGFGATAVAAYSPRWRPGTGVSTPVDWREIDDDLRGDHFNLSNVPVRLKKMQRDPWREFWRCRQSLDAGMRARLTNLDERAPGPARRR